MYSYLAHLGLYDAGYVLDASSLLLTLAPLLYKVWIRMHNSLGTRRKNTTTSKGLARFGVLCRDDRETTSERGQLD